MISTTTHKRQFFPVAILRNGIVLIDGHMAYTDAQGRWLYVSEDGQTVVMYNTISGLINELYRRNDDEDYVVTGWDVAPYRFDGYVDEAYNYYNARFED